jgi:hypothetical protein
MSTTIYSNLARHREQRPLQKYLHLASEGEKKATTKIFVPGSQGFKPASVCTAHPHFFFLFDHLGRIPTPPHTTHCFVFGQPIHFVSQHRPIRSRLDPRQYMNHGSCKSMVTPLPPRYLMRISSRLGWARAHNGRTAHAQFLQHVPPCDPRMVPLVYLVFGAGGTGATLEPWVVHCCRWRWSVASFAIVNAGTRQARRGGRIGRRPR